MLVTEYNIKDVFESIAGKVDDEFFENIVELIYLSFESIKIEEIAKMYKMDDDLFKKGIEIASELDVNYKMCDHLRELGMNEAEEDLVRICKNKESEYTSEVKAKFGIE